MTFLKSVFLGCEGSYNILGQNVTFDAQPKGFDMPDVDGAGFISRLAMKCMSSKAFHRLTFGYSHVMVHEMSHALANKILTGKNSEITCFTLDCTGVARYTESANKEWKNSVIAAAGPMGDIAYSSCQLAAAAALKSYISWPVALAMGTGAAFWISGELLYAYVSAVKKDNGDFGQIVKNGKSHLAVATTAVVSELALGAFAVFMVLNK